MDEVMQYCPEIEPHDQENWCDRVEILPNKERLGDRPVPSWAIYISTTERLQGTSFGEQWVFTYPCELIQEGKIVTAVQPRPTSMKEAFDYAARASLPVLGVQIDPQFLVPCTSRFLNRGKLLFKTDSISLITALLMLPGRWYEVKSWVDPQLIKRIRQTCCSQPGCSSKPTSLFKLKDSNQRKILYRHFCRRHIERGYNGLQDSTLNYELCQSSLDSLEGRPKRF